MIVVIGDLIDDIVVLGASRLVHGTDNAASITHTRGGSAANVAAAAAERHPSRFIGRIGDDAAGEALASRLAAAGVDVRVQRGGRTGSIVVLVDDAGERTMLTDRAAAGELTTIDPEWLDDAVWLHVPLYGFLEHESKAAIAGAIALRPHVPLSIDLSSTDAMRRIGAAELTEIMRRVRPAVIFANADEARQWETFGLTAPADSVLVVKRGGEPVRLVSSEGVQEVPVERAARVVDSTGAGDAFAAGFLVAAVAGADPAGCTRAGADLALAALDRAGAL